MQPTRPELLGEKPGVLRFVSLENVGVCAWQGQATGPAVRTLVGIVDDLLARTTKAHSFIHLVPNRVTLPDTEGREGLIEMMNRHAGRTACAAIVIEGSGFWVAAMRSAVTGLRVLVPRSFEYRLHGSVGEVFEWLPAAHAARTRVEISAEELKTAIALAQRAKREAFDDRTRLK